MHERPAVTVASRSFSRHPLLRAELAARWGAVRFNDSGRSLAGAELADFLRGSPRAILGLEAVDDALLARLPELSVISKYGVGLDALDLHALARRGVRLGWSAGVNRRAVAELALTFALMLRRGLPRANLIAREGRWTQPVGRQLSGAAVGVVGAGNVGRELIKLLAPFGCRLLAHDRRAQPEFYAAHGVSAVPLDELLSGADIVSLHLPLDATTRDFLGPRELALLRPGAILINTARGGLVHEAALLGHLERGTIAAAGFDVLRDEPPADLRLVRHPSFFGTPHIGGSTEEAIVAMGRAAIANLERPRLAAEVLAELAPPREGA